VATIRVSVDVEASRREVWRAIEDVAGHVAWMEDAVAIRFRPGPRAGVGTTFECDTKVGPFRLTDLMEITEWKPRRSMGVRHAGLVTGTGRFTLQRRRGGGTRFTWAERLVFPWWMGGPVGGAVGATLLRRIWRRNLRNLVALVDGRR
jgi:hypothetical protein